MKYKKLLALVLAVALLGGVGFGYAAGAGSSGDPLISLSFAKGDYAENLLTSANKDISSQLDTAFKDASGGLGGGDTGEFKLVSMKAGGEIRLSFGGSVIMQSGAATLNIEKGEVINVSGGTAVSSGALKAQNRYLAAEGASALVKFTAQSTVLVDGAYEILSGEGEASPFTDINSSNWFYSDVLSAVKMGLINGMADTTFVPNGTMTNAQVIKLAACAHQKYNEGAVTLTNGSPWYKSYADYALKNGLISEAPANYDAACARSYYIAVMYKALPESEYAKINTIADNAVPDVPRGAEYYDEIYAFYRAGIVTGIDKNGTFAPGTDVKRSEVATLVARMFDSAVRQTVKLP